MRKFRITIEGKAYDVSIEELDGASDGPAAPPPALSPPRPAAASGGAEAVTSQISGTVVRVEVSDGQRVETGAALLVLEAMKMNATVSAPRAGTVRDIRVKPGDSVEEGQVLLSLA